MSSQSEDEDGVHPLVSNLLGQKFIPRTGHVFRYDRDEMMRLSRVPLSVSRPDNLSVDFNGDDGKFSPFKWLEHRWEVEGIKNRAPAKKLQDVLNAGAMDENAGLSPQRRGWSGGCRAPQASDDKGKEANSGGSFGIDGWSVSDGRSDREKDRLGSTGAKNWRSGANGGTEKYNVAKSNDFKLPFQKTSGTNERNGRSNAWRSGTEGKERERSHLFSNSSGKFAQSKSYRDERNERMPEWADGPTTMDDMIELRGFEEPTKKGKKNASNRERGAREREKEEKEKKMEAKRDRENGKAHAETQQRSVSRESSSGCATSTSSMPTALPESDAELAAILGLLDMQDDMGCMFDKPSPPKDNVSATPAASGSRLSRFFKNSSQESTAPPNHAQPPVGSGIIPHTTCRSSSQEDSQMSNHLLAKIFAQTPSSGGHSPQSSAVPTIGGVRGMRLEDIEKAIGNKGNEARPESTAKGNPLQDPSQQAHLLSKLHKFAKQQEESCGIPPQSGASPPPTGPGGLFPSAGGFMPGVGVPPVLPPGAPIPPVVLARMAAENPALMQAHLHVQFQQAMAAQMANGGVPPSHIQEQMRANLIRLHQQQALAAAIQSQNQNKGRPQTTQMIPSSVQRQMNKTSTSQSEERRDKDGSPTHETDPIVAAARGNADLLKKIQMQHQYAAIMNAMQGGLPMAAWRPPPPPTNGPLPPNQQAQAIIMQMAQVQQIRMKQQAAMVKLMQMHGQHNLQMTPGVDRSGSSFASGSVPSGSTGIPSELSQVGPIQSPLEKLLAAAGVQPAQFTGGVSDSVPSHSSRIPPSARPISLEELERTLTEQSK